MKTLAHDIDDFKNERVAVDTEAPVVRSRHWKSQALDLLGCAGAHRLTARERDCLWRLATRLVIPTGRDLEALRTITERIGGRS